ncbi:MAG: NAD(P)-dependent oxidoreductase [Acidobacteria bacterium]|nr:MAG: NAD(P)-dependent oxidoreductase [Acidobacteriota bacterium]REK09730.1 MAG: NAD(P)-dependent oxidoreductase [Acidobacteriota bacterium]
MATVAFIGLGVMGYPMAGHLVRAGHRVAVYNRTRSRAERWLEELGDEHSVLAPTPREAALQGDYVMLCVGDDNDVRAVALGPDGATAGMEPGSVLVDHTTASATVARQLDAVCRENGGSFLDAPVSGGQAGAEKGTLTVMCGGSEESFDKASDVIWSYAANVTRIGPAGSGQLAKMVNQICIAGLLQGLSEALHFAERAGLDPHRVVEAISRGAAQSWQMDHRADTMLAGEFDHGFAVQWMRKDLGIALREARARGVSLPVTALVDQLYAEVEAIGGRRWDTSSLIARQRHAHRRAPTPSGDDARDDDTEAETVHEEELQ